MEKKISDAEMEKLKNTYIRREMIEKIIKKDAIIYTKEGKLLLIFKKGKVKGGKEYYENMIEFMKAHPSSNRGSASGSKEKNVKENEKVKTIISGYFDRWSPKQKYVFKRMGKPAPLEVRETMYTAREPEKYEKVKKYIKEIDKLYKESVPEKYKKQKKKADETEFKIGQTSFTTVTTNLNFQTSIHKDSGDDAEGFGNVTVIEKGEYTGGETCFPQYGIGVDVREGDILFMDVHEWHGNLAKEGKGDRMSVVCYLRRKLWERTRKKKGLLEKHKKSLKRLGLKSSS